MLWHYFYIYFTYLHTFPSDSWPLVTSSSAPGLVLVSSTRVSSWQMFPRQHFPAQLWISNHRSASPNSRLVSYIKGLLTSFCQRQQNEHGCCSWSWHYRPDCGCPLCLVLNQCSHGIAYMRSMLFQRTHNETLREIETQHPLVSGVKPIFPMLCVTVHFLTHAKAQVDTYEKSINRCIWKVAYKAIQELRTHYMSFRSLKRRRRRRTL